MNLLKMAKEVERTFIIVLINAVSRCGRCELLDGPFKCRKMLNRACVSTTKLMRTLIFAFYRDRQWG